ncbi:hypothetical protein Ancab_016449 [Ancistrocladus abbreviatus]
MNTILTILAKFLVRSAKAQSIFMPQHTLKWGSSLSVEKPSDILVSQNGVFSAGFHQVGDNAFCFAIWSMRSADQIVVWMANREYPISGKYSELILMQNGNLEMVDTGLTPIWSSNTLTAYTVQLLLLDNGNLVLQTLKLPKLYKSHNWIQKVHITELKKATSNFRQEIGKGASGTVYKGILSDGKVAAIKQLNDATQREAEFLAEVNLIGRLDDMNSIEMWGYCAESNCRLLVFEFMEQGSLADNLYSNSLNWEKRNEIDLGTTSGLAYLHKECLEWVLHCDVKPQNILLDSGYQAKVVDFG